MTDSKQTYPEPVAGLMRLGDVRGEKEWINYLELGLTGQHVPDLCRMMLDEALNRADGESDEVWSAVHAWRALAQLKATSALPALIELLGREDEYDDDWIGEELPVVFSYLGPPALEPLREFLADAGQGTWSRTTAATSLVKISQRHPEVRAECVAILSGQLEQFASQTPAFNGLLIGGLIDLKAVEAAPVMERAFAAGAVDLWLQGDWEAVQIRLGLLDQRITPEPDYRALMAEEMGFPPMDLAEEVAAIDRAEAQHKAERKAAKKNKAKARAKRKQARKARKKQRKRK